MQFKEEYRVSGVHMAQKIPPKTLITYDVVESNLGAVVIGATPRGVCWLSFGADEGHMRERFDEAPFERGNLSDALDDPLALDLYGTDFQRDIWRALLDIPSGVTRTYAQVARAAGRPKAIRAAGSAIGSNPVSVLVPCHRVIRSDGGMGGYAWGMPIKEKLLSLETQNIAH